MSSKEEIGSRLSCHEGMKSRGLRSELVVNDVVADHPDRIRVDSKLAHLRESARIPLVLVIDMKEERGLTTMRSNLGIEHAQTYPA